MAEIKCIDVSEWQGNIDFKKVKAAGVNYAILRAGFGRESSQIDAQFEEYYKNARAAGLKLGVYWYSYAVDTVDAVNEAKACLSVIKGKTFELPVFYDMEESFQTEYGKAVLTKMAQAFLGEISKSGYKTGIYANANWFENYLDYNVFYGTHYVWLAQYNNVAEFECDIWQYTSGGSVKGIAGNVDMNVIYNSNLAAEKSEPSKVNLETAALQAMLKIANRLGVISQTIPSINNKQDEAFNKAVNAMTKAVDAKAVDLVFVNRFYQKIVDSIPVVGDVNNDGKVNIRDATALQKELAGIKDE